MLDYFVSVVASVPGLPAGESYATPPPGDPDGRRRNVYMAVRPERRLVRRDRRLSWVRPSLALILAPD